MDNQKNLSVTIITCQCYNNFDHIKKWVALTTGIMFQCLKRQDNLKHQQIKAKILICHIIHLLSSNPNAFNVFLKNSLNMCYYTKMTLFIYFAEESV